MESSEQINTLNTADLDQIKLKCPNLSEQLIQETIEAFSTFDFDQEGIVYEIEVIATMLMSMGCDVTKQQILDLYEQLFNEKMLDGEDAQVTLIQFAQMVDNFVKETDPIDGVISSIQDQYDESETGKCKYEDILKFMEEYNYLEADKESCLKILQEFKEADDSIDYGKAMRKLIQ